MKTLTIEEGKDWHYKILLANSVLIKNCLDPRDLNVTRDSISKCLQEKLEIPNYQARNLTRMLCFIARGLSFPETFHEKEEMIRIKSNLKRWTAEEDVFLKENYGNPTRYLATYLKRNPIIVRERLIELGLNRRAYLSTIIDAEMNRIPFRDLDLDSLDILKKFLNLSGICRNSHYEIVRKYKRLSMIQIRGILYEIFGIKIDENLIGKYRKYLLNLKEIPDDEELHRISEQNLKKLRKERVKIGCSHPELPDKDFPCLTIWQRKRIEKYLIIGLSLRDTNLAIQVDGFKISYGTIQSIREKLKKEGFLPNNKKMNLSVQSLTFLKKSQLH